MSEMVARVAQAIMDCDTDILEIVAVRAARAAIEAMREPTEAMILAGHNAADRWNAEARPLSNVLMRSAATYTAMIDAANPGGHHASTQAEDEGGQEGGR